MTLHLPPTGDRWRLHPALITALSVIAAIAVVVGAVVLALHVLAAALHALLPSIVTTGALFMIIRFMLGGRRPR